MTELEVEIKTDK